MSGKNRITLRKDKEAKKKEIKAKAAEIDSLLEHNWSQRKIYYWAFLALLVIGIHRKIYEHTQGEPLEANVSSTLFSFMNHAAIFLFTFAQMGRLWYQLNGFNDIDKLNLDLDKIKKDQLELQYPAVQFLLGVFQSDKKQTAIKKSTEEAKLLLHYDKKEEINFLPLLRPGTKSGDNVIKHILGFAGYLDVRPSAKPSLPIVIPSSEAEPPEEQTEEKHRPVTP